MSLWRLALLFSHSGPQRPAMELPVVAVATSQRTNLLNRVVEWGTRNRSRPRVQWRGTTLTRFCSWTAWMTRNPTILLYPTSHFWLTGTITLIFSLSHLLCTLSRRPPSALEVLGWLHPPWFPPHIAPPFTSTLHHSHPPPTPHHSTRHPSPLPTPSPYPSHHLSTPLSKP